MYTYNITHDNVFLLLRLLAGHFVADFLLQSAHCVRQKRKKGWGSPWLYIHGCTAGALAYIVSATWAAVWLFGALAVSHIMIDGIKAKTDDNARTFILDQTAHLLAIVLLWLALVPRGYINFGGDILQVAGNPRIWLVALAYIVIIWPVGAAVGQITKGWRTSEKQTSEKRSKTDAGPDKGGLLIGRSRAVPNIDTDATRPV